MRYGPMKPVIYLVTLLSLLGVTPAAWAGPAEEIAVIGQQRGVAFEKGDADGFTAAFADNAVFTPSLQPFRVDGKAAIKDYFAAFFDTYPTHRTAARQVSTSVYANDTIFVSDNYLVLTLTDKTGKVSVDYLRVSTTWLKMGSEWRIVDQHNSRMPIP
jgi:uncharacterized protein (TIGR02246 family)